MSAQADTEVIVQFESWRSDFLTDVHTASPATARSLVAEMVGSSVEVLSFEPVFRADRKLGELRSEAFARQVAEVRERFSDRVARGSGAQTPALDGFYKLTAMSLEDAQVLRAGLAQHGDVRSVWTNTPMELQSQLPSVSYVPNDPWVSSDGVNWSTGLMGQVTGYADLWAHQRIKVLESWEEFADPQFGPGAGVLVGVVDSGIDYDHPDVTNQIWNNTADPVNGVDDDLNGYVDDHRGWDFFANPVDPTVQDNDPRDSVTHGTHMAGIIGAEGNNGVAMIGVAPNVTLMPVKVFADTHTVTTSGTVSQGVQYAVDNGCDVLNFSFACTTGPCTPNPILEAAVQYADSLGAIVVVAAGNNGQDVANYSPQNMPETIDVSAVDRLDNRVWSNFNAELAAPGGGNWTNPDPPDQFYWYTLLSLRSAANIYGGAHVGTHGIRLYGTSGASAYTTGLIAAMISRYPSYTNAQLRQTLLISLEDLGVPGYDPEYGNGLIDALDALDPHVCTSEADPNVHGVPCEFATIQEAIDVAVDGDTVLLEDGVYTGSGNTNLLLVKSIALTSENGPANCILDGAGTSPLIRSVAFLPSATNPVVEGLTLRNGRASGADPSGGAIRVAGDNMFLTLVDCTIEDCTADGSGGGIQSASPLTIERCLIRNNEALGLVSGTGLGGGIATFSQNLTIPIEINNSLVAGNSSASHGGGVFTSGQTVRVRNCTIADNTAGTSILGSKGGGLHADSTVILTSDIFWNNVNGTEPSDHQIGTGLSSNTSIDYCDVQGGAAGITGSGHTWGSGNIAADPKFKSTTGYRLKANLTPCVNKGDPAYVAAPGETDIDGESRVRQGRVDQGFDEVKKKAAKL